jgi:hypothetical protein
MTATPSVKRPRGNSLPSAALVRAHNAIAGATAVRTLAGILIKELKPTLNFYHHGFGGTIVLFYRCA